MVNEKHPKSKRVIVIAAAIVVVLGGGIAALTYWAVAGKTVYIDKAQIQAPLVTLTASTPGILRAVYVREGDVIRPNTVVAQAGVELIKSTSGGLVVAVNNNIGKQVSSQDIIVSLVDPSQLRVVGQVAENKGFTLIHVGQTVEFTVDAFGGKKYLGLVDEVSPTSHASGVVFNISDQRETQTFDIKVRYDTSALPQLKNGMSARVWIYVK
jgi:multidrug resistance efflux pump